MWTSKSSSDPSSSSSAAAPPSSDVPFPTAALLAASAAAAAAVSTGTSPVVAGSSPSELDLQGVACKYGKACTRPNCKFVHSDAGKNFFIISQNVRIFMFAHHHREFLLQESHAALALHARGLTAAISTRFALLLFFVHLCL